MQKASNLYKDSIKQSVRNRGYIRATIGIVNSDAQNNIESSDQNKLAYFSNTIKPFKGYSVEKPYATAEENYSKIDGTMYFLPEKDSGYEYYNNGLVSDELFGSFLIKFMDMTGLDIKGLTIEFGEYFPTNFDIEWDEGTRTYQNNSSRFVTEDVFENVSYFKITANSMVNGNGRLRIHEIMCGIAKTFVNENVSSYTFKDYVSPISETIPSQDMSLEVDNQNLYYSVDNPESAFAFFEVGQEIKVSFGYDVTGNGDIEWLPENTCYLKTWKADDIKARFTATDRFDYLSGKYYGGKYYPDGISLYDLAIDVLMDAGITDEREYFIDPYLKNVIVNNPIPIVKHSEALQIIANAGRCILYQDRKKRIRMKSSFVPELSVDANNKTEYSSIDKLLKTDKKEAYAIQSNDFSVVDGTLYFMPSNGQYKETGYVSNSIADENGLFAENPIITIIPEAAFAVYGILLSFRNVAPEEYVITTYLDEKQVNKITVSNPELNSMVPDEFEPFDRMEIEFTKGHPYARITIDNILVNDITDYTLELSKDIQGTPTGERKNKVKSISVGQHIYIQTSEIKTLKTEKIVLTNNVTRKTIYLTKPSFDFAVSTGSENVTAQIIAQSSYAVAVEFTKVSEGNIAVDCTVSGKEYEVNDYQYTVNHNEYGDEISWDNPLISTNELASDLEQWLAEHFLGDVEYNIPWRGDPRIDAGDLLYLELKNRETALIKVYENSLKFNGAWNATSKARKAVVKWQ